MRIIWEILILIKDYIFILNIIFLLLIIFFERKSPTHTLYWISLLIFAPYLGLVTFIFFGLSLKKSKKIRKLYSRNALYHRINYFFPKESNLNNWNELIEYLEVAQAGNLSTADNFNVFNHGNEFFKSMIEDIESAQYIICMEYYIFRDDELGYKLYSALVNKAKEGVQIKVILDGINSIPFEKVKHFKKMGIEVEIFFPSFFDRFRFLSIKANYRNHRKLTIIDNKIAYIGGFNIGNEYIGKSKMGNWRDTALRIEGNVLNEFIKEFYSSWNFIKKSKNEKIYLPGIKNDKYQYSDSKITVQLVSGGPNFQTPTIRDNFLNLIIKAKKSIYIETPYFVPDEAVYDALKIAALSGVDIKIIIPDKPDHFFIYWVNQSFAWDLIELGVSFYRYNLGFLHSKFAIIDSEIATIGTSNFDYRSFHKNFEININLYNGKIIKELRAIFIEDLKNSHKLTIKNYGKRTLVEKIKESIFRLFSPML